MRDVVVFYTYSGNSRRTAERIAAARNADLVEIHDVRPRPRGVRNYWRSGFNSMFGRSPAILPTRPIRADERVILCCPIWAGKIAAPVRSWLNDHGREVKDIAVVLHSGFPSDWPKATAEIGRLTRCAGFYATDIGGSDYKEPRYARRVAQILEALKRTERAAA